MAAWSLPLPPSSVFLRHLIAALVIFLALGVLYATSPRRVVYVLPQRTNACDAMVERMIQQGIAPLTCNGRKFDPASGTFR